MVILDLVIVGIVSNVIKLKKGGIMEPAIILLAFVVVGKLIILFQ